jgi:hypothetical protein
MVHILAAMIAAEADRLIVDTDGTPATPVMLPLAMRAP